MDHCDNYQTNMIEVAKNTLSVNQDNAYNNHGCELVQEEEKNTG